MQFLLGVGVTHPAPVRRVKSRSLGGPSGRGAVRRLSRGVMWVASLSDDESKQFDRTKPDEQ